MAIEKLFYSINAGHECVVRSQAREIDPRGIHSKCHSPVYAIKIHGDINV